MSAIVYFTNKEPPQVYITLMYGRMNVVTAGFIFYMIEGESFV